MKKLTLSNRLSTVADLIGDRRGVADVGTDHGFLPVWLAQNSRVLRIVAADIRQGPLDRAKKTAAEYGVSNGIEFVLTDGLTDIDPSDLDTVVIAGMGGETIVHILEGAPWTRNESVLCVLQPQTKTDDLLAYLRKSGFLLMDATLACDDGRLYLILAACAGRGDGVFENPMDLLHRKRDPLLQDWLDHQIGKTRRALDGLARAEGRKSGLAEKKAALEALLTMEEATDKWHK